MSDTKTLQAALDNEVKALGDLIAQFKNDATAVVVESGNVTIDQRAYEAAESHRQKITQLKKILGYDNEIKGAKEFLEGKDDTSRFGNATNEYKSVSQLFVESPELKEFIENGSREMHSPVRLDFPDIVSRKDVYSAMASYTPTYNIASNVQQLPIVPAFEIPQRVRDLFPAASTNSNLLEYWIDNGLDNEGDGQAATVAERTGDNSNFALKPKSNISFQHATDPVKTIAHWIPAHRNTLSDAPQLRSLIDNKLLYGLARQEDWQLLNGDGAGENLLGLLNRPGIQQYTPAAAEWKSDSLRRTLTLAELAGFPATGFVLHPLDWEDVELQRGSTNDHYAITTNIAVGAQQRVWRTRVVTTTHIAEGTFLTAAFGTACQIYDREQANIRVAEQHSDYFARNAIAILAEERLGLVVQNPGAVVAGTFLTA